MKKLGDIFGKNRGSFGRFVIISTLFFFFFLLFKPGTNLINWARTRIEVSRQEKLIKSYKEKIKELDERINSLESDRDTLEKYAREEFRLAAPGEDVYIVPAE